MTHQDTTTKPTTTEHDTDTAVLPSLIGNLSRRTMLKTSALAAGGLALTSPTAATSGTTGTTAAVDSSDKFYVDLLAGHSAFPDDVAAKFRIGYDDGDQGTIISNLPQNASTVMMARVRWGPGGTSGWHTHPGPVIVVVTAGALELTNERDCVTRTYSAGEAFVDPGQGNIHVAANASDSDDAVAYATFLGVPAGTSPTIMVAPADC